MNCLDIRTVEVVLFRGWLVCSKHWSSFAAWLSHCRQVGVVRHKLRRRKRLRQRSIAAV